MATQIPRDFEEGDGPTLDDMNAILAALRELREAVNGAVSPLRYCKTPGGGIAAGNNSANCTMAGRNPSTGVMVDGTATLKVWNLPGSTQAVGGSVYIVAGYVNGRWVAIAEAC